MQKWQIQLFGLIGLVIATTSARTLQPEILNFFQSSEPQINLKSRKTTAQRISAHGYPAETHRTTTEDGYIITFFRIPFSHKLQNHGGERPVVFIQHGLFSSSDGWMLNGPNDGLPFMLADAGFDVWLGNTRGNTYCRNHTTRSVNHPYFWRFSWHEIGYYDLAAMIDYALLTSGHQHEALHYVGHSQGTTVFLVLMSERPEYNAKIKTAHMLAPVAFMNHMNDRLVRTLAPYLGYHSTYAALFDSQEFLPSNDLFMLLGYNACGSEGYLLGLCTSIAYWLEGDSSKRNKTTMVYLAETHPAGSSTNQICHYMQEQQSGRFCRYDYGAKQNAKLYGQPIPPDYAVWLISAETHLWYSDNDDMAALVDVERLAELLPNKVMHHVEDPLWAHGDFSTAMEVRETINEPLIAIMRKYEAEAMR